MILSWMQPSGAEAEPNELGAADLLAEPPARWVVHRNRNAFEGCGATNIEGANEEEWDAVARNRPPATPEQAQALCLQDPNCDGYTYDPKKGIYWKLKDINPNSEEFKRCWGYELNVYVKGNPFARWLVHKGCNAHSGRGATNMEGATAEEWDSVATARPPVTVAEAQAACDQDPECMGFTYDPEDMHYWKLKDINPAKFAMCWGYDHGVYDVYIKDDGSNDVVACNGGSWGDGCDSWDSWGKGKGKGAKGWGSLDGMDGWGSLDGFKGKGPMWGPGPVDWSMDGWPMDGWSMGAAPPLEWQPGTPPPPPPGAPPLPPPGEPCGKSGGKCDGKGKGKGKCDGKGKTGSHKGKGSTTVTLVCPASQAGREDVVLEGCQQFAIQAGLSPPEGVTVLVGNINLCHVKFPYPEAAADFIEATKSSGVSLQGGLKIDGKVFRVKHARGTLDGADTDAQPQARLASSKHKEEYQQALSGPNAEMWSNYLTMFGQPVGKRAKVEPRDLVTSHVAAADSGGGGAAVQSTAARAPPSGGSPLKSTKADPAVLIKEPVLIKSAPPADISKLSVKELRALAREHVVDITRCLEKQHIVEELTKALKPLTPAV